MNEELKPCPFCGGGAHLNIRADQHRYYVFAHCGNCMCETNGRLTDVSQAIDKWNQRVEPSLQTQSVIADED